MTRVAQDQVEHEYVRRVLAHVPVETRGDKEHQVGEETDDSAREDGASDCNVNGIIIRILKPGICQTGVVAGHVEQI